MADQVIPNFSWSADNSLACIIRIALACIWKVFHGFAENLACTGGLYITSELKRTIRPYQQIRALAVGPLLAIVPVICGLAGMKPWPATAPWPLQTLKSHQGHRRAPGAGAFIPSLSGKWIGNGRKIKGSLCQRETRRKGGRRERIKSLMRAVISAGKTKWVISTLNQTMAVSSPPTVQIRVACFMSFLPLILHWSSFFFLPPFTFLSFNWIVAIRRQGPWKTRKPGLG